MRRASIYYMPESGLILYQILNTSIIGGGETEKCIDLYNLHHKVQKLNDDEEIKNP